MLLNIPGIQEIIILFILILINIPIIYFTVMSLFYDFFNEDASKSKSEQKEKSKKDEKITMTPIVFVKVIILIVFIIGIFTAEIILIDKIGMTYFEYHFMQKLFMVGQ